MKVYKWVLCVVLVVVFSGGLFLFGNYKSADSGLENVPVQTTTAAYTEEEHTEFTFSEEVYNNQLIMMINAYRERFGLSPWEVLDDISMSAKTRAHECVLMNSKSHERPSGEQWYTVLGMEDGAENYQYSELIGFEDQAPETLLRKWVSQDTIKDSILLSEEYIACGIGTEAIGSTVYCVLITYKN